MLAKKNGHGKTISFAAEFSIAGIDVYDDLFGIGPIGKSTLGDVSGHFFISRPGVKTLLRFLPAHIPGNTSEHERGPYPWRAVPRNDGLNVPFEDVVARPNPVAHGPAHIPDGRRQIRCRS
jgi:hypothetical protein